MIGTTRDARHASLIVVAILLCVYVSTGAATLTFWDASEFATAIGTFGIPHPPGTPLYVAIGAALWHLVPGISPVQAGTLLSALSTSVACAIAAWLIVRVSGQQWLGVVAGLCAGAMGTVWLNATETEVYALSLLCGVLQFACAWRARAEDDDRARVAVAYLAAIALPLHLSALVAAPAAMLLANTASDGSIRWRALVSAGALVLATVLLSLGLWLAALGCVAAVALDSRIHGKEMRWLLPAAGATLVGWTAVLILLVRARHDPFLNQGDPDILPRLLDVLTRAQYDVAGPWPRRAPFWLQLGNIGQYADWQVALALWSDVTPSWLRTPFTAAAAMLGIGGAVAHWRTERVSARAMLALFLLATVGVCVQLNLRAGPSFGVGVLPDGALHEARERDYFFALGFWCWGLWIGIGAAAAFRMLPRPAVVAAVLPMLMLIGNWRGVTRAAMPDKVIASAIGAELLRGVPVRGLLFTAGDNDSYPLWYLQAIDSIRPDVQVVVTSLLPANWYFRESAARAGRLLADTTRSGAAIARASGLARQQLDRRGSVAVSIVVSSADREELGRLAGVTCWRRVALVEVGTRTSVCPPRIDAQRAVESADRLGPLVRFVPRQSPDGMIGAFQAMARCPGLAARVALHGASSLDLRSRTLLDITCNLQ